MPLSIRLLDHCSIVQAEIAAIRIAVEKIQYRGILGGNIRILTDSKAAIKSLENMTPLREMFENVGRLLKR